MDADSLLRICRRRQTGCACTSLCNRPKQGQILEQMGHRIRTVRQRRKISVNQPGGGKSRIPESTAGEIVRDMQIQIRNSGKTIAARFHISERSIRYRLRNASTHYRRHLYNQHDWRRGRQHYAGSDSDFRCRAGSGRRSDRDCDRIRLHCPVQSFYRQKEKLLAICFCQGNVLSPLEDMPMHSCTA